MYYSNKFNGLNEANVLVAYVALNKKPCNLDDIIFELNQRLKSQLGILDISLVALTLHCMLDVRNITADCDKPVRVSNVNVCVAKFECDYFRIRKYFKYYCSLFELLDCSSAMKIGFWQS